jgi:hypothetical protein
VSGLDLKRLKQESGAGIQKSELKSFNHRGHGNLKATGGARYQVLVRQAKLAHQNLTPDSFAGHPAKRLRQRVYSVPY